MVRPNFAQCGSEFLNYSSTIYSKYVYTGAVDGILQKGKPVLITLEGCKELCGDGIEYYAWKDAANTITTWVLPIIGLLVQAPFESNQAWNTFLSLCRWSGSPISTISYILWNIKITGKCALMIDMSVKYDEYPEEESEFSYMRDSMFLLCVMNQYNPRHSIPPIEGESLLRITLFSNSLQLNGSQDKRDSLLYRRSELARRFREERKKGVIPVLVSFLWFVFALGLSIELAFNDIGGNETAHDLAIGLLVGWLPVLIVGCAVDRNLVSADSVRERINELINDVRDALSHGEESNRFRMKRAETAIDFAGKEFDESEKDFFESFGGQGRSHFHYGVAHPILSGIETKFIADYGRDWLRNGHAARHAMVMGSRHPKGLKMFDARMVWQISGSLFIVAGTVFGAFILSWFTPTVGLGCRTGGYLIYIIIAMGLVTIELGTWAVTHMTSQTEFDPLRRVGTTLSRKFSTLSAPSDDPSIYKYHITLAFRRLEAGSLRGFMKNFIIRPIEVANTVWLCYIIFAQTFGSYETCECMASNWAGRGGFIDFETYNSYVAYGVYVYWGSATALSCFVMGLGLCYIVHEYCTQSHLSTEDYGRAMQGLRMTRWFKKQSLIFRVGPDLILRFGKFLGHKVSGGATRKSRRSLTWTVGVKKEHQPINQEGA